MQTIILQRCDEHRDISRVIGFISELPITKRWRLRIDELKGDRTEHQNNALFGVAYPQLCQHIGCMPDELHEIMCEKFFGTKAVMGKTFPIRSTTKDAEGRRDVINWEVFKSFYEMVQQVGSECGVWIPDPDRSLRTR